MSSLPVEPRRMHGVLVRVNNKRGCPACGGAQKEGQVLCEPCGERLLVKVLFVEIEPAAISPAPRTGNTWEVSVKEFIENAHPILRTFNYKTDRVLYITAKGAHMLQLDRPLEKPTEGD